MLTIFRRSRIFKGDFIFDNKKKKKKKKKKKIMITVK